MQKFRNLSEALSSNSLKFRLARGCTKEREKVLYDLKNVMFDFFLDIFSSNIRSTIKEIQSQEKDKCFKIKTDFELFLNISFAPTRML